MTTKRTVQSFFQAWKDNQLDTCLSFVQLTWLHAMRNPDRSLSQKFMEFLQGLDYSKRPLIMLRKKLDNWDVARIDSIDIIEAPNMNPDVVKDALISIKTAKGRLVKLCVRLLKENDPYKPSKTGDWGINPASIHEI